MLCGDHWLCPLGMGDYLYVFVDVDIIVIDKLSKQLKIFAFYLKWGKGSSGI